MNLMTLRQTLINFAENPNQSWGTPTDGNGNPTDINAGEQARVRIEQADRNTARINSGTYTTEQLRDFERELVKVERDGSGTACFPGDPDYLPTSLPEGTCHCGKRFRSNKHDLKALCYTCALDQLCPALPGRHIQGFWKQDGWRMEVHGDIGFRDETEFWWSNQNSGGNSGHQGLAVKRTPKGAIRRLVFSTVAMNARRCYAVTFDLEVGSVRLAYADKVSSLRSNYIADHNYAKFTELQTLDDIVLDLMIAMVPSWMLYAHRPRNPANGCFANY